MNLQKRTFFFLSFVILFFLSVFLKETVYAETPTPTSVSSANTNQAQQDLENKISDLQNKIKDSQGQQKTLSSQISIMNNQILLTQLRVDSTKQQILFIEVDIDTTTKKITTLEASLNNLTKILLNRIVATYQISSTQPFYVLLSSDSPSNFMTRLSYLKVVQEHDKKLIYATEQAKNDYITQKSIFETKKKKAVTLKTQLESYTMQLASEQKAKQTLLGVTKNDEKRYQDLLARARAEFEAIQGIVAGKGIETQIGDVGEGQKIASVISGASCNSSGSHLHFVVSRNGTTESPFGYLKSGIDFQNCSGSSCGSSDADSFNPTGSWNWPIDPTIKFVQGYGSTWATGNDPIIRQIYSFHNGIDISGGSDVKAVQAGTLYQGSYNGYNGCRLRYVRVHHKDSGLDTFYLHINYSS